MFFLLMFYAQKFYCDFNLNFTEVCDILQAYFNYLVFDCHQQVSDGQASVIRIDLVIVHNNTPDLMMRYSFCLIRYQMIFSKAISGTGILKKEMHHWTTWETSTFSQRSITWLQPITGKYVSTSSGLVAQGQWVNWTFHPVLALGQMFDPHS